MKIVGLENLSTAQVNEELQRGARFVIFQYCISILVMSFKRSSHVYFVPAGQSSAKKGGLYCLVSLVAGWWGFPWGPIWTIGTVAKNLGGGIDVTREVLASMNASAPVPRAPMPLN